MKGRLAAMLLLGGWFGGVWGLCGSAIVCVVAAAFPRRARWVNMALWAVMVLVIQLTVSHSAYRANFGTALLPHVIGIVLAVSVFVTALFDQSSDDDVRHADDRLATASGLEADTYARVIDVGDVRPPPISRLRAGLFCCIAGTAGVAAAISIDGAPSPVTVAVVGVLVTVAVVTIPRSCVAPTSPTADP